MKKRSRRYQVALALGDYIDLLIADKAPAPGEYAARFPELNPELTEACEDALWVKETFDLLKHKPMPAEARRRMVCRVLRPIRQAISQQTRDYVEQHKSRRELAPKHRIELLLVLLYLAGRERLKEPVRGTTRLMKLTFLAQQQLRRSYPRCRFGDYEYEFAPGRFGPSAGELYDDLQALIWADLIKRTDFDDDGLPITYLSSEAMPDTDFSLPNALYELTPEGEAHANKLHRYLSKHHPGLLEELGRLKAALAGMTTEQIAWEIYRRYPQYIVESDLLRELKQRQAETEQEP